MPDNGMTGNTNTAPTDQRLVVAAGGNIPMAEPLDTVAPLGGWPKLLYKTYPKLAWDPALRAQILVAEFAENPWRTSIKLAAWDPGLLASEIDTLVGYQKNLRPDRMSELVAQSQDFTPYFADLLLMTPASHPNNWMLLSAAMAIGHMVGMFFKDRFNRPRPVQVYPSLMPPLLTPPHPSYPNNHALQSYLIAEVLCLSNPLAAGPLRELASRIKENREIAGFHFPSDGEASHAVGEKVVLMMQAGCLFKEILGEAKKEWGEVSVLPSLPGAGEAVAGCA